MLRTLTQRSRVLASHKSAAAPVVFLSYGHSEAKIALELRTALASCGLQVLIDVDHLKPGEDIARFARESVRAADATVSCSTPVPCSTSVRSAPSAQIDA